MIKDKSEIKVWDDVAINYNDEINKSEQNLYEEIHNVFKKIGLKEEDNLIELGSGSGHLSYQLARQGYHVTLLDFSKVALEKAKKLYDTNEVVAEYIQADLRESINTSKEYKIAWNSGVLEHFNDDELVKIIKNIMDIKSEYYVFIMPNILSLPYLLYRYRQIADNNWAYGKEYLRDDYQDIFEKLGLKVVDIVYLGEEFSAQHMSVYTKGEDTSYISQLFDQAIIKDDQKYLVGYILKKDSVNNKKTNNDIVMKSLTEQKTLIFDLISEKDGLQKSNKILEEKIIELINKNNKNELLFEEYISIKEKIKIKDEIINSQNELLNNYNKIIADKEQIIKSKDNIISSQEKEIKKYNKVENVKKEVLHLKEIIQEKEKIINYLEIRNNNLNQEKDSFSSQLWQIHHSNFWKVASSYYKFRDKIPGVRYLKERRNSNKNTNIIETENLNLKEVQTPVTVESNTYRKIAELLTMNHKYIIIFAPLVDWNIPLFQRPQHIALNLGKLGKPYFYCTTNTYDQVEGFEAVKGFSNLYLTTEYDTLMQSDAKKVFHMYAQDFNIKKEDIESILDAGNIILYEYIDALSDQLCTGKENVLERHIEVLKDERCIVVCTASNLYDEVAKYRENNFSLVTNGVEIEHFSQTFTDEDIPQSIAHVVEKRKPIIGYFGALAKWFDYELIEKLSDQHPDYEILLVGWDYDQSLQKTTLTNKDNVTIVGPIDYKELPKYAYWFDVSTIPFLINEITLATSPIKLFEYMALGHPIVTTDMPECRKYKSVDIGQTHDEFIKKVEEAVIKKDDKTTKEILKKEALENTWLAKAQCIEELIKKNL